MADHNVTKLSDWKNRDTAQLLRHLAEQLEQGHLDGMCLQAIDHRGAERIFCTGAYSRDHGLAWMAGLKISMELTMLAGAQDQG